MNELPIPAPAPGGATILDRTNRTFICSVLFLDIIEYSRKPVSEQILLKERFNALIAESIGNIPPDDRIILDTGDGVAINFLGDPEDALFVAMNLRDAFRRPLPGGLMLEARIGLNLGPVRLVKDLNGQPNIIGDGINVAQRVMSFADRGQVLVSRSYFEVVSHISDGYAQLFSYRGSRTDKHVREHEIYEVGARVPPQMANKSGGARTPANDAEGPAAGNVARPESPVPTARATPWWANVRAAYVAALISVLVLAGAVVVSERRSDEPAEPVAARVAKVTRPVTTVAASEKPVIRKMVELDELIVLPPEPPTDRGDLRHGRKRTTSVAAVERASMDGRAEPAAPPPPAVPAPAAGSAQAEPAPAEKAVIAFAVSPWGEVYVNGNKLGVTPPVNVVEVAAGKAEIEIRNPGFPSYTETVELTPGQRLRVKHKF